MNFNQALEQAYPKEPNLWIEKEARPRQKMQLPDATYTQIQNFLEKVTYKIGREIYDLKEHEFRFTFAPNVRVNYKILGGYRVLVMFSLLPFDKNFDATMRRALSDVSIVKRSTAIDTIARIQQRNNDLPEVIDPAVPITETFAECYDVVRVTHKRTGIISVKSSLMGTETITRLIGFARTEIAETLALLKEVNQDGSNKQPRTRGTGTSGETSEVEAGEGRVEESENQAGEGNSTPGETGLGAVVQGARDSNSST